jgi:outer membrane immunogenic protein
MKKFAVALTVLASFVATPILAADLAVKAPPPPPPPAPTWTGCYLGVEAGYGWSRVHDTVSYAPPGPFFPLTPYAPSADPNGAMGGVQVGCDYQWGNQWLVGVIATYDFSTISSGTNTTVNPLAPTYLPHTFSEDIDGFGTVRGRIGWLFAPNWLVYGSGGLAYGRIITSANSSFLPLGANTYSYPGTATWQTGWTAGGGVEWKFSDHISVFAEYLYAELSSTSHIENTFAPAFAGVDTVADSYSRPKINVIKAGINWRLW